MLQPEFRELNTLRYVDPIVKQGAKPRYKPAHQDRQVQINIQ